MQDDDRTREDDSMDRTEETAEAPAEQVESLPEDRASARGGRNFDPKGLGLTVMVSVAVFLVVVLVGSLPRGGRDKGEGAQSELAQAQAELEARRLALGLGGGPGAGEPLEEISSRLRRDAETLASLGGRVQALLVEKEGELALKGAELLRSERDRQSLLAEMARLRGEVDAARLAASESESLTRRLADERATVERLREELATARERLAASAGAPSEDDFADLRRRFEETSRAKEFFEARAAELEEELARTRLFASSERELLPAAVELFRKLRELEGHPESDLTSAYSQLGAQLEANVLHALTFATGSSELTAEDRSLVRRVVNEVPDGDLVLVIGYASTTGDVVANQRLSSDRATAVAMEFSEAKRPGQTVQAVYLGQTDRFSERTPERNQLCEIWHIRRQR